ncbi:MAG: PAM68 family protein [Leptolyngbyaceae cyanobacterium bins.349]|nr:PAM68 family protein [Leptolyngbyaceae cyanobacterium bins.349]
MSSKPQPAPQKGSNDNKASSDAVDAGKSRLPFEPAQNRKKQAKKAAAPAAKAANDTPSKTDQKPTVRQRAFTGVPKEVSQRMARRMALFCGVPTGLGMLTFVVSYFVVSQHLLKLPTVAVFLVSLGFFGLGVLGLSYGAFSASWDEGRVGSWLGWSEFRTNLGRAIASWKEAREKTL